MDYTEDFELEKSSINAKIIFFYFYFFHALLVHFKIYELLYIRIRQLSAISNSDKSGLQTHTVIIWGMSNTCINRSRVVETHHSFGNHFTDWVAGRNCQQQSFILMTSFEMVINPICREPLVAFVVKMHKTIWAI